MASAIEAIETELAMTTVTSSIHSGAWGDAVEDEVIFTKPVEGTGSADGFVRVGPPPKKDGPYGMSYKALRTAVWNFCLFFLNKMTHKKSPIARELTSILGEVGKYVSIVGPPKYEIDPDTGLTSPVHGTSDIDKFFNYIKDGVRVNEIKGITHDASGNYNHIKSYRLAALIIHGSDVYNYMDTDSDFKNLKEYLPNAKTLIETLEESFEQITEKHPGCVLEVMKTDCPLIVRVAVVSPSTPVPTLIQKNPDGSKTVAVIPKVTDAVSAPSKPSSYAGKVGGGAKQPPKKTDEVTIIVPEKKTPSKAPEEQKAPVTDSIAQLVKYLQTIEQFGLCSMTYDELKEAFESGSLPGVALKLMA